MEAFFVQGVCRYLELIFKAKDEKPMKLIASIHIHKCVEAYINFLAIFPTYLIEIYFGCIYIRLVQIRKARQ